MILRFDRQTKQSYQKSAEGTHSAKHAPHTTGAHGSLEPRIPHSAHPIAVFSGSERCKAIKRSKAIHFLRDVIKKRHQVRLGPDSAQVRSQDTKLKGQFKYQEGGRAPGLALTQRKLRCKWGLERHCFSRRATPGHPDKLCLEIFQQEMGNPPLTVSSGITHLQPAVHNQASPPSPQGFLPFSRWGEATSPGCEEGFLQSSTAFQGGGCG